MNHNAPGFPPPPPYGAAPSSPYGAAPSSPYGAAPSSPYGAAPPPSHGAPPPRPPVGPPLGHHGGTPGQQPPLGRAGRPAPTAPLPAGPSGRRIATVVVLGLVLVAAVGAGIYLLLGGTVPFGSAAPTQPAAVSTDAPASAPGTDTGSTAGGGTGDPDVAFAAGGAGVTPDCPFTAARVSELVGQPMKDGGSCLFGDGNGVATLTIVPASASTTEMTMDYMRDSATRMYANVEDLPGGTKGWIATKDVEAMAMAVTGKGGYTITMSSFQRLGGDGYTPVLRDVVAALPR
ncbi:hypothetical protein [Pseudonocardia dioxanivorans]|uniref:hypothetical protein n=2 Tax=Pseudonocardia dioxanivorans TaxID=240495 RepID=UPI00104579A7|nr:hypothetical protein [Pseudonocardia dioxanivorans]